MKLHHVGLGGADNLLGPNPNDHAKAPKAFVAGAEGDTCQFLGRTFHDGDTICYQRGVWVCRSGAWVATGEACGAP